ncbi:MAG: serine/threonine protein kinase [Arenimonas sp.]
MSEDHEDPQAPFADLDPDRILEAVESLGFVCDGRVLALNSYENRVYRIGRENDLPLVAKFYRPERWTDEAIVEEHAFSAELLAADISVVAPMLINGKTLHHDEALRFALFPMQGGHSPEPGDKETLIHIGRALGRLHSVGASKDFLHREKLSIESKAEEPVHYLLEAHWLPNELEDNFISLCNQLIDQIEITWQRAGRFDTLRLHGDCHPGNLLWRNDSVHFVDLDDALTGPAMQDLWMLLNGSRETRAQQLGWLLEGYEVFWKFNRAELHLIEALRAMRIIHYHAWIARRWHDPAFPAAFPWFESSRHWEGVITQLQEQLSVMQEPVIILR